MTEKQPKTPEFNIGDIVEIAGEYAAEWRGSLHMIGQVYWNKKKNRLEYGTYQVGSNDGLTDEWSEENLRLHKRAASMQPPLLVEKWIAEIKAHEMALRIAEAVLRLHRPPGLTAEECLTLMKKTDAESVAGFYRAAGAAGKYLEESINNYQRVQ